MEVLDGFSLLSITQHHLTERKVLFRERTAALLENVLRWSTGVSVALFAPGWVYEEGDRATWLDRQQEFWGRLESSWSPPRATAVSLPFASSFDQGAGLATYQQVPQHRPQVLKLISRRLVWAWRFGLGILDFWLGILFEIWVWNVGLGLRFRAGVFRPLYSLRLSAR